MNPQVEERKETAFKKQEQAKTALNRIANITPKDQFRVNDKVWLNSKNLALPYQTLKLAPRCHGPFVITHRISPVAYQLKLPQAWTIHDVFHAGLLTPYHETSQYGPNHTRPPPDLVGGEEEFEVEAIMNHRHHGRARRLQYLVKWKGYPKADNTWEPVEQMFAPELIRKYHLKCPLETYKRTHPQRRVNIRSSYQWIPHFPQSATQLSLTSSSPQRTKSLSPHLHPLLLSLSRQPWPTTSWAKPLKGTPSLPRPPTQPSKPMGQSFHPKWRSFL